MSVAPQLRAAMATVNDALRGVFANAGTRCFLLKWGEHTQAFTNIGELTAGYIVEFDDNRSESGLLRHATSTLTFRDDWAEATHVAYGVPQSSILEVYAFVEGEKDTIDPDGFSNFWSGRIVKVKNKRYTVV